ncbi:MAG: TonB-dependent receptor [Sphingobacteriaceae bacterium]|nr:MAG: TonB-dependent receptor [Sphingobacteriaceae bacterium]
MLLATQAFAQTYVVNGTVTDNTGKLLPMVNINLNGAVNRQTLTDTLGKFTLSTTASGEYHLTATYLGYADAAIHLHIKQPFVSVRLKLTQQNRQLNEVTITDRYTNKRKREESLNVEVVNSGFIQRNLGGSLMATLSRLPGVKTIGIGSGQSKPLIRGLGFNRVVVADKGVKHEGQQWGADHGLELDQFAAGEVELVKGAASFIYGSDAIAGVIDVKPPSAPPAHTLGGSVDLIGKTNNNLYGTSVNLFGRNEHWFFDSRFTYQNYGDYRVPADTVFVYDYAVNLHKNHLRNTAGRETGLHFNTGYVSDKFSSVFYLSSVYSKSGFFANAHGLEPLKVNTVVYDRSSRDVLNPNQEVNHFKLINRTRYQAGNHQWQAELGYQHNFRQEFNNYMNHGYMPPVYPDTMRIPRNLEREFEKDVYSINLRDQIQFGRHQLTIGGNAEYQNNRISGWSFLAPSFNQTTAGLSVYDKFRLTDDVVLHGAIRYDHGHMRIKSYTDWFPSNGEYVVRAENMARNFNSLVWSAGINYTPEGIFSLKANVGKSFRMPIAKELAANGVNYHYFSYERGNPTLSPEQSYQADLTLGWNTDKWSIQVSPFYNYFPNYIYLNPTAEHDYLYGAGNQVFVYAESRVMRYGGELQLKYRFTNWLSSEILGEYLYARQLSGDKEGYTLPEKETAGYGVVNLQAGTRINLKNRSIIVSAQVQNLLNTRYLNHTSFYRLIGLPEAGRNIILSVKIPFVLITPTTTTHY